MTSHELATQMREVADLLLARAPFKMNYPEKFIYKIPFWYDKDNFVTAIRTMGSGEKFVDVGVISDTGVKYKTVSGGEVILAIDRSKVCRLVKEAQPAQYECESFLSREEEAELSK